MIRPPAPRSTRRTRTVAAAATAGLLTALAPLAVPTAEAAPQDKGPKKGAACDKQNNNTYQ